MTQENNSPTLQFLDALSTPNFVIGPHGQPVAVIIDIATWQAIIEQLEDAEDIAIFRTFADDLNALARGEQPEGIRPWEEFEAELEALEQEDALPA